MNKTIDVILTKDSKIYNEFNNSKLSSELSNYILEQSKGIPLKSIIILNINSYFYMEKEEKQKLVNEIRENYGLDIKENLIKLKYEVIKQVIMLLIGLILSFISNLVSNNNYLISQFFYIFGWLIIYESISGLIFSNIKTMYQNKKYKKLINAKITFNELKKDN